MPKPTRRQRRMGKVKPLRRPVIAPGPKPAQAKEIETSPSASKVVIAPGEYDYVYKDLRRIAILAGIMFFGLFILSFILR